MRAAVRRLHSPDAPLDDWTPEDPNDVGVLIQIMVGPAGAEGEESFDVFVCTPRWLDRKVTATGPLVGRHHLIVARYDFIEIRRFLTALVEGEEGADWDEVVARLARIGFWEFEDYQE